MLLREIAAATNPLHQKYLGQMGAHLLVSADQHVVCPALPAAAQLSLGAGIDEGGIALALPAVMQESLGVGLLQPWQS
jgi:hypothetical protein